MFNRIFGRSPSRSSRRSLNVETLGARVVPAVLVKTFDLDSDGAVDDIRITGDAQNSIVTVSDNGSNQLTVNVDANGNGSFADNGDTQQTFTFSGNSVVVEANMGAGKDSLTYTPTTGLSGDTRTFLVNMGSGNDTFNWDMNNLAVSSHSRIKLDVWMGTGNDTVNETFGLVDNALLSLQTNMGAGNDIFNQTFGQIDFGASVDVDTDLGAGKNTHNVVTNRVGYSDQATMTMNILGGNSIDTIEVKMLDDVGGGTKASFFTLNANLQGGNDVFKGLLNNSFRVDDHSQAAFNVLGGNGNDDLSIFGDGAGELKLDTDSLLSIDLDGGAGNDTISVALLQIFQGVTLDHYGTLRTRLTGGAGNDKITAYFMNNATSTGAYDIVIKGDAGNDQMTFNLFNQGGAAITLGAGNGVIIDGGSGVDNLEDGSPGYVVDNAVEVMI